MKLFVFVTSVSLALAQMPVKRVVLYKNGVGYFEHQVTVEGKQDISVSFSSGQLNDVLKSLTVLDLSGGRIAAIGYDATLPTDRKLSDIRLPVGDKGTLVEFLTAMRGARIETRNGSTALVGRLVSVERKTRAGAGPTLEVDLVSVLTDAGELRTAEVSPTFAVRLLEPGLAVKMGKYLDVLSVGREADERKIVISADGTGPRSLFVSYISEVPVWKATYRIVLGPKPLLQGWAIIDNTVGQDWDKVSLSLVAGAPQSFVQNLGQPQYARRPVVAVAETVNRAPQTFESGVVVGAARLAGVVRDGSGGAIAGVLVFVADLNGAALGNGVTNNQGQFEVDGLAEGVVQLRVSHSGYEATRTEGIALLSGTTVKRDLQLRLVPTGQASSVEAVVNRANATPPPMNRFERLRQFSLLQSAPIVRFLEPRLQTQPAVQAKELGDLFEYRIEHPVSIARNRSALVPILQAPVTIEKVSVWSEGAGGSRPQRALWLTNLTGLTLDAGTFSVAEAEAFAGEGVMEAIRPAEQRLLSYATDLAVTVTTALGSEKQRVARVVAKDGNLTLHQSMVERKSYTIRNNDPAARTLVLEHPVRAGYQLRGAAVPAETTATAMRFRVPVGAQQTVAFVVEEAKPMSTVYSIGQLDGPTIANFVTEGSINPAVEAALREVLAQSAIVVELFREAERLTDDQTRIVKDQERMRENLKALKGSVEEKALVQRYTRQLDEQENRLAELGQQADLLETKLKAAQVEFKRRIGSVGLDVTL